MPIESPVSGSSSAPRGKRKTIGLSPARELSLKARLRKTTCSEPWVEAQFKRATDSDEEGHKITYRYHDPRVYPPGGERTAMVRCRKCGIFTPPGAIEHGCCLDHANHAGWGPSPSAVAFQAMQRYNLRLEDSVELRSEKILVLKREISRYHARIKRLEKAKKYS